MWWHTTGLKKSTFQRYILFKVKLEKKSNLFIIYFQLSIISSVFNSPINRYNMCQKNCSYPYTCVHAGLASSLFFFIINGLYHNHIVEKTRLGRDMDINGYLLLCWLRRDPSLMIQTILKLFDHFKYVGLMKKSEAIICLRKKE